MCHVVSYNYYVYRSGTEEELTELMELLHDIITYENDCAHKKESEEMAARRKREEEKQRGEQLRKAAMERLSSMSESR